MCHSIAHYPLYTNGEHCQWAATAAFMGSDSSHFEYLLAARLAGPGKIAMLPRGTGKTGSLAMMSKGNHSLVDTDIRFLLPYSIKPAANPANAEFPFGWVGIYF